jgi:hypothetical protein
MNFADLEIREMVNLEIIELSKTILQKSSLANK